MLGYKSCRSCCSLMNCADLVSGLCPACARERAARLSDLQRDYQAAVEAGDPAASSRVADLILAYQASEGVRLRDVPGALRAEALKRPSEPF